MTIRSLPRLALGALALGAVTLVALPLAVRAQTPAPPAPAPATPAPAPTGAPMPPREPLPAPPGIRPFAVPQELVGRELGLDEAVNIALENAPLIVARIGDYVASQQRVNQALAPLLPQLTGIGSYGRARTVGIVVGNAGYQDFGSARLNLSQLLFDFGRTWAARDVAKSNAEALKEVLEAQKLDISQLVKTQYFTLLLSKRLVEVNLAALDRAQVNLRSAQGFFQVGTQPKSFVTRAEVDVANARVNVIRAQNAVGLARVALNTAMGVAVNAPTEVKDLLSYQDFPTDRNLLVSEALRNRPEYRQVKAQADAADALVRQTFRDFFPNLTGTGNYGLVGITGSTGQTSRSTSGFTDVNNVWELGLSLNWSIFDGGGRIARYKEAKATVEASQARVRDAELQIWQNVEQTYLNLGEAAERIGAAQKALESASENYQLARGRFDAGVANIIELTDAQLALTQAQSDEAQALADYRISIARLERALGRR
ncbi:MAG TPA: TolC family protein [Methylomirabilota bacterium]|nr:TolC family protein [Methylomirabilota bacterium]